MSNYCYGFDDFENMLDEVLNVMPSAADEIVKEIGLEILSEAIENVNGPHISNVSSSQPYPVSVNQGHLRRSLKIKRLGRAKYKVFSDLEVANYGPYVHDGTSRMRPRPFLEDGVKAVINTGKYIEIANDILEEFLGGI